MKTLIKTTLALAIMFATATGYAHYEDKSIFKSFVNELPISSFKKGQQLQVKNSSGSVIYSKAIAVDGQFENTFDLSSLKDGFYTLEIIKDFEIKVKRFAVADHNVTYLKNGETTLFKPVFKLKDNKILVSQLSFDSDEWEIKLYFDNEIIHSEKVKGGPILERVFVLGENVRGEYKVLIKNNERSYVETFKS